MKMNSIKKSSEESIKHMIEATSLNNRKHSLPRLDQRDKINLLWMMGQDIKTEKLVNHLMDKP
jgi:hypothetical protein